LSDIDYMSSNNNDCSVKDEIGKYQRAMLVATPGGFGSQIPFETRVSMGLEEGMSIVDKFGSNPDVDTATTPEYIWPLGDGYGWGNDLGETLYISSSDTDDTQDIIVSVLTLDGLGNWNLEDVTVTLEGQTQKAIVTPSGDPVVRCFRAESEADMGDDLLGDVYVYYDNTVVTGVPQTHDKILSYIPLGVSKNQSKQLMYTIPSGFWGFLYRGEAGITRGGSANECEFSYLSRRKGKVFKEKKDFGVTNQGSPYYQDLRPFQDIIPPQTDLAIRAVVVGANDTPVWATFHILLITDERFQELQGNN
jgi:hypothetical protein